MEQPYREVVTDYLNIIFGNSGEATAYWTSGDLKARVEDYFAGSLTQEEAAHQFDLRKNVDLCKLFVHMRKVTGIIFSPHCSLDVDPRNMQQVNCAVL